MRVKPKREWGFYDWVDGRFIFIPWRTYVSRDAWPDKKDVA